MIILSLSIVLHGKVCMFVCMKVHVNAMRHRGTWECVTKALNGDEEKKKQAVAAVKESQLPVDERSFDPRQLKDTVGSQCKVRRFLRG